MRFLQARSQLICNKFRLLRKIKIGSDIRTPWSKCTYFSILFYRRQNISASKFHRCKCSLCNGMTDTNTFFHIFASIKAKFLHIILILKRFHRRGWNTADYCHQEWIEMEWVIEASWGFTSRQKKLDMQMKIIYMQDILILGRCLKIRWIFTYN